MDQRRQWDIEKGERIRQRVRGEYAQRREELDRRRRYIAQHGRLGGAFRTLTKWLFGAIGTGVTMAAFVANDPNNGSIFEAATGVGLLVFAIGIYRALTVLCTSRY